MAAEPIDPATFEEYSGPSPTCKKCLSSGGAACYWMPSGLTFLTNGQVRWDGYWDPGNVDDEPGYFIRYCELCHYAWPELTLDTSGQPQPVLASSEPRAATKTGGTAKPTKEFVVNQPFTPVLELK